MKPWLDIFGLDLATTPDRSALGVVTREGFRHLHDLPLGAEVRHYVTKGGGNTIVVVHPGGPPYYVHPVTGETSPVLP